MYRHVRKSPKEQPPAVSKPATVSDLVWKIAARVKELADQPIDQLRSQYPEATETRAELVRFCRESGFTRGVLIEAIVTEEFIPVIDGEIQW